MIQTSVQVKGFLKNVTVEVCTSILYSEKILEKLHVVLKQASLDHRQFSIHKSSEGLTTTYSVTFEHISYSLFQTVFRKLRSLVKA